MKSYRKIFARKFRRKLYSFLVAVLTAVSAKFNTWLKNANEELLRITARPFRLATFKNQPLFPRISLVSSTREALKVLGNPEPTSKDIAEALKRTDKVRGDGKLPPQTEEERDRISITLAEKARGLHKSLNLGITEADLARDEAEIAALEAKVVEKIEAVQEAQAEKNA